MSAPGVNGLASMSIGGRVYPLVSAPGCKTCGSKYRREIEAALVRGFSLAQILRHLPGDHGLVERNLRDHLRSAHLPLTSVAVQKLAEEEAEERGRVVEAGADVLASHAAFARAVIGRVRERVAKGEIEPDIRDALVATKLLFEFEGDPSAVDHEGLVQAMARLMEVIRATLTPDQFTELGRQVSRDPLLSAFRKAAGRRP